MIKNIKARHRQKTTLKFEHGELNLKLPPMVQIAQELGGVPDTTSDPFERVYDSIRIRAAGERTWRPRKATDRTISATRDSSVCPEQ
jgi:hypothetical protein